jgi:uncharacterized protein (DUF608 family)
MLNRRAFLSSLGIGAAVYLHSRLPIRADALDNPNFDPLLPADKKLNPEWIASLFDRGTPQVYSQGDLRNIGMPISGICAGQELNLSGEGKLTGWRVHGTSLENVAQSFALRLIADGNKTDIPLDQRGFPNLTFRGEYPLATIAYANASVPVKVNLEAFSPYVPLETEDSSLPATIFHFTITNTSGYPVDVGLMGSWENAALGFNRDKVAGTRRNQHVRVDNLSLLNFSAEPAGPGESVKNDKGVTTSFNHLPDWGTMALALVGLPADLIAASGTDQPAENAEAPLSGHISGTLVRALHLASGESAKVTFILTEHFPNCDVRQLMEKDAQGNPVPPQRWYATKFKNAQAVAEYVGANLQRLTEATRLWRDTWYDSTLPYWFLDRTFANASTPASGVCYRIASGRFYAYEGAPAPNYEGTCTHVWQYAHSLARTFPDLERDTRERVDLGIAFDEPSGVIAFRGEASPGGLATDGQAGTLLRFYREHQMAADDSFLKRNWTKIKQAFKPLFDLDPGGDGILEGRQNNTLDCGWYGQIAWMSGEYVAALRAGEAMAREIGDADFAAKCAKIAQVGTHNLATKLFNGEYFFNIIDPKNAEWINSGDGCHVDQLFGQSWAMQLGLPRIFPETESLTALASIWKYNFAPDSCAYLQSKKIGRGFSNPGDPGLIMTSFPRTDWNFEKAKGTQPYGQGFAGYFNETWTGQEYQVAAHMIAEGMVREGLSIVRAIHDRYHPSKRNPWAEEEAGIHYSRAMASHGTFLAVCGYEHHGPKGHLGFAPKLTPEDFRAPFTAAEGWGTYAQTITNRKMWANVEIKRGRLRLKTLTLALPGVTPGSATARLAEQDVSVTAVTEGERVTLAFAQPIVIQAGGKLEIGVG